MGESGCGKSTCLQLVQRLYDVDNDPKDGGILIDGRDVRELQTSWLRQNIGVVSQEPNLFNLTIRDNIAYGDLSREIPMEEIITAAQKANIHDFIVSLPEVAILFIFPRNILLAWNPHYNKHGTSITDTISSSKPSSFSN